MVFGVDDALMIASTGAGIFNSLKNGGPDKTQQALAIKQMQMQEEENFLKNYYSQKALADQKLGSTDASGNHTHFVPGQGYVVDMSPMSQSLLNASETEQLKRSTVDAPLARELLQRNYGRQLDEGDQAANILQQLQQGPPESRGQLESIYRDRASRDLNKGYDDADQSISRQGLRTGANMGKAYSRNATARAESLNKSNTDATLQADQVYDTREGNRTNGLGSLYSMFAGRAAGMPGATYSPFDTGSVNSNLSTEQGRGGQLGMNLANQSYNDFSNVKFPDANKAYAAQANAIGVGVNDIASTLYNQFKNRQQGNSGYTNAGWSNFLQSN